MKIRHHVEMITLGRFKSLIEKGGETFLRRIFTAGERSYCNAIRLRHENYGARLAAKRAILKTLGFSQDPKLYRHIDIGRYPNGQPYVKLSLAFCKRFKISQAIKIEVSIAHERKYAIAAVVLMDTR
ncbi:Phosphopantethiene-protein transferase [sediment metagenome]|uniref:Phosphopantethiene-protein transferase n=1 Tax=sediment metagenome TaxID=749907 RepID=D9PHR4_9ZZZZ